MMTVNEVSKLTGMSIRTLQYYDTIGLLKPIEYTESGYRLYDDTSLERLQQILLFKELEFPLKEIKKIIDAPNFDRNKALEQQIELLTMKKGINKSILFYVVSALFLIVSAIGLTSGNENTMAIVWLSLGSAFLCLGSAYKKKENNKTNTDDK